jgi:hypothetical protein
VFLRRAEEDDDDEENFVQHHNEVSKYTHMTLNKYLTDLFSISLLSAEMNGMKNEFLTPQNLRL